LYNKEFETVVSFPKKSSRESIMIDNKIRVLLVEDNVPDMKLVTRLLALVPQHPFTLTAVNRLETAIEKLHGFKFDVVLLDLGLPDSKGISTFNAIHSECLDTPIVIFTISGDESLGVEAVSRGAQDYLVKGTSDERIMAKSIRYAIERKRLEVEQRDTHEELLQSEERFRNIFNNAAMGMVEYDTNHKFVSVNDYACHVFGYTPEELLGKLVLDITAPEDLELTKEKNESIHTGRDNKFAYEKRYIRKDGTYIWASVTLSAIRDQDGRHVLTVGTIEDISQRKSSESALLESENKLKILNENLENIVIQRTEQVRALSTALTFAEQRERKRFSYILHEDIQQKLFAAKIIFNQHLRDHEAAKDPSANEDLIDGNKILERALQLTKTLSLELNPPILKTEGLDAALKWLNNHMRNNYGLIVDLEIKGPLNNIKGDFQVFITQLVRELLSNVVKHSGVLKARVKAVFENNQLTVIVKDEGMGFDTDAVVSKAPAESKFGLFSVRERLNLLGGQLKLESRLGNGTECIIIYPDVNCQQGIKR
jgi:two-component system, NarL family, sensor histidine kinase UhpB